MEKWGWKIAVILEPLNPQVVSRSIFPVRAFVLFNISAAGEISSRLQLHRNANYAVVSRLEITSARLATYFQFTGLL